MLGQQHGPAEENREKLCGSLYDAVKGCVEEGFKELEEERQKAKRESARLLAEAHEAMADAKRDAEKVVAMQRDVEKHRAALEEEKAAMEKAHTFSDEQNSSRRRWAQVRNVAPDPDFDPRHVPRVFVLWPI